MQCLEVSDAVRPIYGPLGVKRLIAECGLLTQNKSSEDWNLLRIVNLR